MISAALSSVSSSWTLNNQQFTSISTTTTSLSSASYGGCKCGTARICCWSPCCWAPATVERHLTPAGRAAANPSTLLQRSTDGTDRQEDGQWTVTKTLLCILRQQCQALLQYWYCHLANNIMLCASNACSFLPNKNIDRVQVCLHQWRNFTLKSGGDQWREQRGAEWDGVEYGEGCPLPSRLEGLGERRELPQRGLGGAPAAIAFSAYFRPQNAFGSKKNTILLPKYKEKLVVRKTAILWNFGLLEKLQIPLWKSGGDMSPSSHTKLRLWSVYFTMGWEMSTTLPTLWGSGPHLIHGSSGPA